MLPKLRTQQYTGSNGQAAKQWCVTVLLAASCDNTRSSSGGGGGGGGVLILMRDVSIIGQNKATCY